jgi:hypothetical protein
MRAKGRVAVAACMKEGETNGFLLYEDTHDWLDVCGS